MIYDDRNIYKNNQTSISSKEVNLWSDDFFEEVLDNDARLNFSFRKKLTFKDMKGSIKLNYNTNSLDLEKELYAWSKL